MENRLQRTIHYKDTNTKRYKKIDYKDTKKEQI